MKPKILDTKYQRAKEYFDNNPYGMYEEYDDKGKLVYWICYDGDWDECFYDKNDKLVFYYECWKTTIRGINFMNIITYK